MLLEVVGSPVVCAAPPVPGMFAPGLPPDAADPDAPPTIPVSLPFFSSTSSQAPGGTTGAAELGAGALGAGAAVLAGGLEGVSPLAAGDDGGGVVRSP